MSKATKMAPSKESKSAEEDLALKNKIEETKKKIAEIKSIMEKCPNCKRFLEPETPPLPAKKKTRKPKL